MKTRVVVILVLLSMMLIAGPTSRSADPIIVEYLTSIPASLRPRSVAFSPDGERAYVAIAGETDEGEAVVEVVRVADHTRLESDTIVLGDAILGSWNIHDVEVTPDGEYLYAAWRGRSRLGPGPHSVPPVALQHRRFREKA